MKLFILACAVLAGCAPKPALSDAEQMALGERAYQRCFSCHALEPGQNLSGPALKSIIGRAIATEPGFDYSPAMRGFAASEPRWTKELLDRFVADPEALVPGTSMNFHGIADADDRAALLLYLERR